MEEKLDLILKELSTIKADITGLKTDISELKSDVSEIKENVRKILAFVPVGNEDILKKLDDMSKAIH